MVSRSSKTSCLINLLVISLELISCKIRCMKIKAFYCRLLYSLVYLWCSFTSVTAQNNLIAITPPNDFRFEDLLNINVTTDNTNTYDNYHINIRIFDVSKGLLIEAQSKSFTSAGSVNFNTTNSAQLSPFSYPFKSSTAIESIIQRGGLFPAGSYRVDYLLYGNTGGASTKLTDYTLNHVVIMPSVLQLVSVFDKDTLKEEQPTFMWLPASATQTVGSIESQQEYKMTYTISVAEILTNQTPYMAITSNPQFFYQTGLENTMILYPFSARKLEPCKTYAWQVKGTINNQTIIASEVWTFNTPCEKEIPVPDAPVLVKQKEDLAVCYVRNNTINFAYYEEYNVEEGALLNATIYNSKKEINNTPKQLNLVVNKGYNTFKLNSCPDETNLLNGNNYLLVITNGKNEKWYLRIINDQTVNTCY